MVERFRTSDIIRPLLAFTLAGTALNACTPQGKVFLGGEAQAYTESTSIPTKVLVQVQRLNEEGSKANSNFILVKTESGELILMSEQGNGMHEEGRLIQNAEGTWIFEGNSAEGQAIQAPLVDISADENAQGVLHLEDSKDGTSNVVVPASVLPNLP